MDSDQLIVIEVHDGTHALCQDLTVATVGAEDLVLGRKRHRLADSGALLAGREVGRAKVVEGDALVRPLFLDGVEHRLELADQQHVVVGTHQPILAPYLQFGFDIRLVLVHLNRWQGDGLFLSDRLGIK